MPKLAFTQKEITSYIDGTVVSWSIKRARNRADEMAVHADGLYPLRLIDFRRPNEPEEVRIYRREIYEPLTMPKFGKILGSLQKIRRSTEWAIQYPAEPFNKINAEETLEEYCEHDFPNHTSVTNWAFSILLRNQLIDPNAVIFVKPINFEIGLTEFFQAFPEIFDSYAVVDFKESDYAVLKEKEGTSFLQNGKLEFGDVIWIVTTQSILKYEQVSTNRKFKLTLSYNHQFGELPVWKLKGVLMKQMGGQTFYDSRIAGIIPEFNEAVREGSDLQACMVNHIYAERWEYTNNECPECKGRCRIRNPHWTEDCNCSEEIFCTHCEGRGYMVSGPYSKMIVKPNDPLLQQGNVQIPMPPAGYIEKDVAVVKVLSDSVEAHMYKGLAAINFEFLDAVPLNQSGTAKEWDKDEANNTVHSIAEDLVANIDNVYKFVAYWRYSGLYDIDSINDMLPNIPVPESYDLQSTQHLQDELINGKKNNLNPTILSALEVDYVGKRFLDEKIRNVVVLALTLDPLPNVLTADKTLMLQNNGITELTYVVSCNIIGFIQHATMDDPAFIDMELKDQKEVIETLAQDQIDATKPSNIVKKAMADATNTLTNSDPNAASGATSTTEEAGGGSGTQSNSVLPGMTASDAAFNTNPILNAGL
jgi:hypothetical protein